MRYRGVLGPAGALAAAMLFGCGESKERETLAALTGERPSVDIEWVRIEGGTFMMGSNGRDLAERPVHEVTVPAFEIAKTEVTVGQYRACIEAGACTEPDTGGECNWGREGREDHPMNCVDWEQARAFAHWVGGRLPSEAEWEYAARSGGRDQRYPWGDEDATCERAVMYDGDDGCGEDRTWPVCAKPAGISAQGVCDLAGNVYEWVEDCWHDSYEGAPADGSAWTSACPGALRVARGGSWYNGAGRMRAVHRSWYPPRHRLDYLGFRPARSVEP